MLNSFIILTDALASGYSIKAAARLARVSEAEAKEFFETNESAIDERRRDIKEQFGIVNPVNRIEMLNHIARLGIDGYTVMGKGGVEVTIQNPSVAVQAIKTYSDMEDKLSATAASNSNANEQEKIIRSLFDDLRAELGIQKAADAIKEEFPDYRDFVNELLKVRVGEVVEETAEELK